MASDCVSFVWRADDGEASSVCDAIAKVLAVWRLWRENASGLVGEEVLARGIAAMIDAAGAWVVSGAAQLRHRENKGASNAR